MCSPYLLMLSLLFSQMVLMAQTENEPETSDAQGIVAEIPEGGFEPAPSTSETSEIEAERRALRLFTFGLAVAVLVFGLLVITLEIWVMMARKKYWDDLSFKIVGLTIIVVSGLFLIVAGYTDKQLSPMMGLLGTTVGYILGRGKQT